MKVHILVTWFLLLWQLGKGKNLTTTYTSKFDLIMYVHIFVWARYDAYIKLFALGKTEKTTLIYSFGGNNLPKTQVDDFT
jgi:hypothetical protein